MSKHIMIDLETMSSACDAAIVAIGAVVFDIEGPQLNMADIDSDNLGSVPCFYICVDLQSCIKAGLRVDGSTVYWWLKQSKEAREALNIQDVTELKVALAVFDSWMETHLECNLSQATIWAHANFDLSILDTAYKAVGRKSVPWKYYNARDVRTMYDIAFAPDKVPGIPDTNKHNALYDAARQAIGVQICHQKLRHSIG